MSPPTSRTLPRPIAAYFAAANTHDSDATAACFVDGAVVHDEGREMRGYVAIRAWKEQTDAKYRPRFHVTDAVADAARVDGRTIVTVQVAGDFPGSPIVLHFAFTLAGEKIALLEIS
jgi:hypothetical protein